LEGDHIDAAEGFGIGYQERLVPCANLDSAVGKWVASLLPCGPRAVRIPKRPIMDWGRMGVTGGARAGIQAYAESGRTDEPNRLMTAFLNRR